MSITVWHITGNYQTSLSVIKHISDSYQLYQWQLSTMSLAVYKHITNKEMMCIQRQTILFWHLYHPPPKKKEKRRWVKDCSTRLLQFIFFQKKPDFKHYSQSSNIKTVWPDSSTLSPNPNQSSMTWIFYTRGMSQDWSTTEALCTN